VKVVTVTVSFVHHKNHMVWAGVATGTPRRDAGN